MAKKEWRINAIALLVFVGMLLAGAYGTFQVNKAEQQREDFLVREVLDAHASAIERRLFDALNAARFIGIEVALLEGQGYDFAEIASREMDNTPGITNLQLAPDGVISEIYPLAGNEKALGLDLMKYNDAHLAVEQRRMVISGPFELVQGGTAIVGREPVFIENRFWGFSSALILLDDLARLTGLHQLENKGYRFRLSVQEKDPRTVLSTINPQNLAGVGFIKSHEIYLPGDNHWLLQVVPPASESVSVITIGAVATLILAMLTALLLRRLLLAPLRLQVQVDEQICQLEHLHNHDVLTGIPNRSFIFEHLEFICRECEQSDDMAALVVFNIDGFKRINDLHGHKKGDVLLKEIAVRIRRLCNPADVIARIGVDEFAVVMADTKDYRALSSVVKKMLRSLEKPISLRKQNISVTVSAGIVVIPVDATNATEVLQNADSAVDDAKAQGISQFAFFNAQQQRQALEKMQMEEYLAVAAERDEYVLHYQPIISLASDEVVGYEALIRWDLPGVGLLYPDKFIDIAESSGAIVPLGYWALKATCRQLKTCQKPCWISVNLSPKQLSAPGLVEQVDLVIRDSGIDPDRLTIEVTESCFIDDVSVAIETLRRLKKLGLHIALDDFGTGFSSLSLLQKLPVDKLKIDRSFIERLERDERDQQIVHGLILIAHKLGLKVIAEGIELEEHQQMLQQMNCDYGQGYFYSKPLPAYAIAEWCDKQQHSA